jgi:hypothetical protein
MAIRGAKVIWVIMNVWVTKVCRVIMIVGLLGLFGFRVIRAVTVITKYATERNFGVRPRSLSLKGNANTLYEPCQFLWEP